MNRRRPVLLTAAAVSLAVAAPASAEERWAAPNASAANTTCLSTSPCTLETAITGAAAADEVIVTSGTYAVGSIAATQPITIHGEEGQPRPVVVGAAEPVAPATEGASTLTLPAGATVSNLELRGSGTGQDALTLKGGASGDRLVLRSADGDGAKVEAATTGPVLSNTLVVTSKDADGFAALKLREKNAGGTLHLRNVTAYATGAAATGVRCEVAIGTVTLVNTVVRGGEFDVDASGSKGGEGMDCAATHSNLRTVKSPGVTGSPIDVADPDVDAGYRPVAGSILIDHGTDDAANGALDLLGRPRTVGTTDVGAFEYDANNAFPALPAPPVTGGTTGGGTTDGGDTTGDTSVPADTAAPAETPAAPRQAPVVPEPAPLLPPAAPPKLGKTVALETGSGAVLVRLPGTSRFIPLSDASALPVGTLVDARKGAVTLQSALTGGKTQKGTFSAGMFTVRQPANGKGYVDIALAGGDFSVCPKPRSSRARGAIARAAARPKVVRRLWGSDKGGRFRTHGKKTVATVRGTRWLTEDRCEGTYTKVTSGAVDVKDRRRGTVKRVRAGRSLLVR